MKLDRRKLLTAGSAYLASCGAGTRHAWIDGAALHPGELGRVRAIEGDDDVAAALSSTTGRSSRAVRELIRASA